MCCSHFKYETPRALHHDVTPDESGILSWTRSVTKAAIIEGPRASLIGMASSAMVIIVTTFWTLAWLLSSKVSFAVDHYSVNDFTARVRDHFIQAGNKFTLFE